jgi:hypothetical protein
MTFPVCDGVGVGGGCVGCAVGDGCGAFVADGEGFGVADLDGIGVFWVPFVGAVVGVLPFTVGGEVCPAVGMLASCDWDCFILEIKWAKLMPPIPNTPTVTVPAASNPTILRRSFCRG